MIAPEFLDGQDIGNWTISINQNDAGAPYFSSADGLTAEELATLNDVFAALFDDGTLIDVMAGKNIKERCYSDLAAQTDRDTNPSIINPPSDEATAVGGTVGTDGTDGGGGTDAVTLTLQRTEVGLDFKDDRQTIRDFCGADTADHQLRAWTNPVTVTPSGKRKGAALSDCAFHRILRLKALSRA